MRKWILFLAASFALAVVAQAVPPTTPANTWTSCSSDSGGTKVWRVAASRGNVIGVGGQGCYEFDETLNTTTADTAFFLQAKSGSVCVDRDVNSTGGALVFELRSCPGNFTPDANTCSAVEATISTDSCTAIKPGLYFINVTTAVIATQDAVIAIRGD